LIAPYRVPCETPAAHRSDAAAGETRWVLPTTILGSSLGFIDSSVVNVALPAISSALDADFATVQWVVNGYMLALASLILLGGAAGDRFGRRRMFVLGLIAFAAASCACALALSPRTLVAARLAQGVAAALLVPASLAIIGAAYSEEARGAAIGTWAAAGALTTALGPPLGGWLVDNVGWRAIFVINLPLAAVAAVLALKLPKDHGPRDAGALDGRGASLAVVALALLSYGLIALGEGQRAAGTIALTASVPAILLFVRAERRAAAPMMPLDLFGNPIFAAANGLTVLLYAALSGALFLLPFMLIEGHGYSTTAAGAAFLPLSAIMGFGSRWSGKLSERTGPRLPLVAGPAITAAGYMLLGLLAEEATYSRGILPGLIVVAVGMTLSVPPLTSAVFSSAPEESSGIASGVNNAAARTGSLLAVAALGLAFGGMHGSSISAGTLANGYQWVMFAAAGLAASSAVIAAMTLGPKKDRAAMSR
jgi:EmrB/QacA subfamily drug resistance transporter